MAQPLEHRIGTNSDTFNANDLVNHASGFLKLVDGTTDRIDGICQKKVVMAADNQTVAKVKVPFIPLRFDVEFEMDFDAVGTEASVGMMFTVAGATGALVVTVASASATVGQVRCVAIDPRDEGNMLRGRFQVALPTTGFEAET